VIGQRIVVVRMQADVVDHYFQSSPADARQALTHIKRESRAALDDLRETVSLLRQPGEATAPTEPVTGLAALPDLITRFTNSGMRVTLHTSGPARTIPAAADLTAYRVIQEALTNVSKHAAGAASTINLSYGKASLRVTVEDDGKHAPPPSGTHTAPDGRGHGIRGMQERVAAAGGYLEAGPRAGFRGFQVTAVLPLLQSAIAGDGES